MTLVNEHCILDIRKYPFSQRKVNEYNTLSIDCVNACSVNMFKNKISQKSLLHIHEE